MYISVTKCCTDIHIKNKKAMKKRKLITFYRLRQPNWHMKCKRTYFQALKMGWRHIFKGHAFAFSVKNV